MRFFGDRSSTPPSVEPDPGRRFTALPRRSDRRSSAITRPPLTPAPRSILRHHQADTGQANPSPQDESYFPYTPPNPDQEAQHKRGSLPAALQPGPRLPPSSTHDVKPRSSSLGVSGEEAARARFSSVPTAGKDRGGGQPAELKARQRYTLEGKGVPPKDHGFHPSSPVSASTRLDILPPLVPKVHYRTLLLRLKRVLRAQGSNIKDYIDAEDIHALYVQDVGDREKRERDRVKIARVRKGLDKDIGLRRVSDEGEPMHVFSAPLRESLGYASTTAILGGYRHDLPIVLFYCIEELYRTGIYRPNLFREIPNRSRHIALLESFNTAPLFGSQIALHIESTSTICALLSTYLKNMAEPILDSVLFTPFWQWCVKPSVQRDERRAQVEEDEEDELRAAAYAEGRTPPKPSKRAILERQNAYAAEDDELEGAQIAAAQLILKLLPTHHFSVLVYLCAFFTQVPLCPENGMTEEDVGKMFGYEVFGGSRVASRLMMAWVLKRWAKLSDGLMSAEDVENAHRQREVMEDEDKARKKREEEDAEGEVKKMALQRRRRSLGIEPKSPAVPFDLIRYSLGEIGEPEIRALERRSRFPAPGTPLHGPAPSGPIPDHGSNSTASESSSSVDTKYHSDNDSESTLGSLENPYSQSGDYKDKGKAKEYFPDDVVIAPDHDFAIDLLPSKTFADGDSSSLVTKDSASRYSVPDISEPQFSVTSSATEYGTAPTSLRAASISPTSTVPRPLPSSTLPLPEAPSMASLPSTGTQLHQARERISELERLLSAKEEGQSVASQLHNVSVPLGKDESEEPLMDLMQEYQEHESARVEEEGKWLGSGGEDSTAVKKMLEEALQEKERAQKEKEEARRVLEDIKSLLALGKPGKA